MRRPRVFVLLLALAVCMSCAPETKKIPALEAQAATKAFTLVQELKDAFVRKDLPAIQARCTDALYADLAADTEKVADLVLTLTMKWVDIDADGTIHLYATWKRQAVLQGKQVKDSGMAVFIIKPRPLLVDGILREIPFR